MKQIKEENIKQKVDTEAWTNTAFKTLNDQELEMVKGGCWYKPWTWFSDEEEGGSGGSGCSGCGGGGGGGGGW